MAYIVLLYQVRSYEGELLANEAAVVLRPQQMVLECKSWMAR